MAKGAREGKGKSSKAGSGSGPSGPLTCAFKILASEPFVAALIGKGGSVISAMRGSCKAKLQFTEYGEVYPNTECRVLTAQTNEEQHMDAVIEQILGKLDEVAREGMDADNVGIEGNMKVKVLVPRAAAGSLIGKGGLTIKLLRDETGAKVSVNDATTSGPAADQVVSASGDESQLRAVLVQISKHIQALKEEGWFQGWATTPGTVSWAYSNLTGGGSTAAASYSPGIDLMVRIAQGLPSYVIEDSRGFALSCVVPNHLVGGLIGRGGSGTREIQTLTGAKIGIREIPDDPENRTLNIAGPLPAACAAYMLMMKRYLDVEQQSGSW